MPENKQLISDQINYIEFPSLNLATTKQFFETHFGWEFANYGDDYISYAYHGQRGGFFRVDHLDATISTLAVIYTHDLEGKLNQITKAGATITKDIFAFPGGRRFHFKIAENEIEFAVWSDK